MDRRINPEMPRWWGWLNRHLHEVWIGAWLGVLLVTIMIGCLD